MRRRGFLQAFLVGTAGFWASRRASATVARAVPLSLLVERSQHVVSGEVLDREVVWENFAGRRHIVTYSRVAVGEVWSGRDPESEVLVRTLGGQLGDLGELVHGEPSLPVGQRAALFLLPFAERSFSITAMAQGHYPVLPDGSGVARLRRSPELGEILDIQQSAVKALHGRSLPQARELVKKAVAR